MPSARPARPHDHRKVDAAGGSDGLGSDHSPASVILERLLVRSSQMIAIDTSVFDRADMLGRRVRSLHRRANLYRRDTGIDGLYLGFPFLLMRDPRVNTKPRIAPVLLWPMRLELEVGNRGQVALGFDGQREEVRLNPAFEEMMGIDTAHRWQEAVQGLLRSVTVTVAQVMDAFSPLARPGGTTLIPLPSRDVQLETPHPEMACAAVLFLAAYGGQAIAEDLRELKGKPPASTALETALRLAGEHLAPEPNPAARESERYFIVDSDPSQEQAVLEARREPGLLIEGPPGTGKSQTIVHMAADAIARRKSLLVICQKQAALDVVRKRLEAAGLNRRIVMLTDFNRDREAIIRQVDEQLGELLARPSASIPVWQRDRERTAVRIEALEDELDRFNEALHRRDDTTGLSYRLVLSELIALENGTRPPIDAPSLRSILGDLDQTQLAEVAESCARLVPDWLPSKFEDSPLAVLRPFTPDRATVETCLEGLLAFVTAETTRKVVTAQTMHAFPIDDPAPYAAWIDQHRSRFESLNEDGWADLRRWGKLFRVAAGSSSPGAKLLGELASIAEGVLSTA